MKELFKNAHPQGNKRPDVWWLRRCKE
jgi:hypothetical protein